MSKVLIGIEEFDSLLKGGLRDGDIMLTLSQSSTETSRSKITRWLCSKCGNNLSYIKESNALVCALCNTRNN